MCLCDCDGPQEDGPDDVGVAAEVLSPSSDDELILEQQGDPSLKESFDRVLSEDEARGRFLRGGLQFIQRGRV